jgi:hypothetical protein
MLLCSFFSSVQKELTYKKKKKEKNIISSGIGETISAETIIALVEAIMSGTEKVHWLALNQIPEGPNARTPFSRIVVKAK